MKAFALREEICRVGRSLFGRGYVHASADRASKTIVLHQRICRAAAAPLTDTRHGVLRTTFGACW